MKKLATAAIVAASIASTHVSAQDLFYHGYKSYSWFGVYTCLRSIDVSAMAIGDSMMFKANVYDAVLSSIANRLVQFQGLRMEAGFNAARTDINDVVRGHSGVVTADDGLDTSVLDQSHRFDNSGMMLRITRI